MNLTDDAMQVSLRITAWSGRLYDRQASNHVAVHHDAAASAGRYNKCLLPKAAFAALTATVSACRTAHYENTVPWDDQGSRLLTVANYEHYTELMNGFRERMVRERARFIKDYDVNVDQARLDLGKLFRIEDYPSKEALQDKFSIRYRITPVQDAEQFMAKLATDDVDRVKRDIEHQIEERLHDAVGDLYRRFGEAVERVSKRLQEDDNGKPLVFRDSMISNIRDLVDIVPRLNIFGDDELARLCEQVKDKIASVEPDSLRPSKTFDPVARVAGEARRRRPDGEVRGLLRDARRARAGGRVMATRVQTESAQRTSDCVTELLRKLLAVVPGCAYMVLFLSGRWRLADGMLLGLADFVSRCGYSVEGPVIDLERFAGAVAHEHVVPVQAVEGRAQADDPAVVSDEPCRGVIALAGGVVGAEDPAGVPGLDPFGEACGGAAGWRPRRIPCARPGRGGGRGPTGRRWRSWRG